MEYALISKKLPLDIVRSHAVKAGVTDIEEARLMGQIFCNLSDEQISILSKIPDLKIKKLKTFRVNAAAPKVMLSSYAHYMPLSENVWSVFNGVRSLFEPPITGSGLTVAVVDTGIRKTHRSLENKIVNEANFSGSPSADDVFGHGTQVAFAVGGGSHDDELVGVSPDTSIVNIKVINDFGIATEDAIVRGIDEVCRLATSAHESMKPRTDKLWPNVINLSLGAPDDGDEDSPLRIACRRAIQDFGLDIVAAAGNSGPNMTTIEIPGTEPLNMTVGGVKTQYDIEIWERSSRGPTQRGDVKPDFVFWSVDVRMASHRSNTGYDVMSGTSFSAPMLSGLTGLLWEAGRREYGENWVFKWTEAREVAHEFCVKPPDAPVHKGNTYGYGLPAVSRMMDELKRVPFSADTDWLFQLMMVLAMFGMVTK